MSGTAQSTSGFVEGNHLCVISMFAKQYDNSIGDNVEDLIEFMKHVPEEDIIEFITKVYNQRGALNLIWWPIIEGNIIIFQKKN